MTVGLKSRCEVRTRSVEFCVMSLVFEVLWFCFGIMMYHACMICLYLCLLCPSLHMFFGYDACVTCLHTPHVHIYIYTHIWSNTFILQYIMPKLCSRIQQDAFEHGAQHYHPQLYAREDHLPTSNHFQISSRKLTWNLRIDRWFRPFSSTTPRGFGVPCGPLQGSKAKESRLTFQELVIHE